MLHYFMVEQDLDHNTAMKHIRNTKQVLTTATGRWIKTNPIRDFRCSYQQPERDVLTIQEIWKIYKKSLIKRMDQVRDVFLFSCFTGLAYKEVYNLTLYDIVIGNDAAVGSRSTGSRPAIRKTFPSYRSPKPLLRNTGMMSVVTILTGCCR
jgi:hypothetical protein